MQIDPKRQTILTFPEAEDMQFPKLAESAARYGEVVCGADE